MKHTQEIELKSRTLNPTLHRRGVANRDANALEAIWPLCRRPSGIFRVLCRNVNRFRRRLVFEAHRLLYHSTLGLREIEKRRRFRVWRLRFEERVWGSYFRVKEYRVEELRVQGLKDGGLTDACQEPLSSESGTCKTVEARLWPWLPGESPENGQKSSTPSG